MIKTIKLFPKYLIVSAILIVETLIPARAAALQDSCITITTSFEGMMRKLGLTGNGKAVIDWGDGSPVDTVTLRTLPSQDHWYRVRQWTVPHTYASPGIKTIRIIGDITGLSTGMTRKVTDIDVSGMPGLKYLECHREQLRAIDISKNPALLHLDCYWNQITSLDVTNNHALLELYCGTNNLIAIDVTENRGLQKLNCSKNHLISLDVSLNIELKDLIFSNNNISTIDVGKNTALWNLSCSGNSISTLDVKRNILLRGLFCANNNLSALDVSENPDLSSLYCDYNNLFELNVNNNPELRRLSCVGNSLTSLDLSKNPALQHLNCSNNYLTVLDVSKYDNLKELYCDNNRLSTLLIYGGSPYFHYNSRLVEFNCSHNNMDKVALTEIFTTLGRRSGDDMAIIKCNNNPGFAELTDNDKAVLTGKKWTMQEK